MTIARPSLALCSRATHACGWRRGGVGSGIAAEVSTLRYSAGPWCASRSLLSTTHAAQDGFKVFQI